MTEQRTGKFGMASVLLVIGSVLIIISPSLVWFREQSQVFGMRLPEIAIKGSDLGAVSALMGFAGKSVFARGEYVVTLGALALLLAAAGFFIPLYRRAIGGLTIVVALLSLVIGIETAARFLPTGDKPGEGLFVLAAGSVLLLIGAVMSRSCVRVTASAGSTPQSGSQTYKPPEDPVPHVLASTSTEALSTSPTESEPHHVVPQVEAKPSTPEAAHPPIGEAIADRNRLVGMAIGLMVLLILSNLVFRLPGTATRLSGNFYVGNLIKLLVLATMMVLVISALHRLANVLCYYIGRLLKADQARATATAHQRKFNEYRDAFGYRQKLCHF